MEKKFYRQRWKDSKLARLDVALALLAFFVFWLWTFQEDSIARLERMEPVQAQITDQYEDVRIESRGRYSSERVKVTVFAFQYRIDGELYRTRASYRLGSEPRVPSALYVDPINPYDSIVAEDYGFQPIHRTYFDALCYGALALLLAGGAYRWRLGKNQPPEPWKPALR